MVSNQHGYVVLMTEELGPDLLNYFLMCVSFYADESTKLLKKKLLIDYQEPGYCSNLQLLELELDSQEENIAVTIICGAQLYSAVFVFHPFVEVHLHLNSQSEERAQVEFLAINHHSTAQSGLTVKLNNENQNDFTWPYEVIACITVIVLVLFLLAKNLSRLKKKHD